jgi:prolyl oligopeptidase
MRNGPALPIAPLALLCACASATAGGPAAQPPANQAAAAPAAPEDPYLWLEEVTAERSLTWVKERNAKSLAELEGDARLAPLRERYQQVYDSKEKIPFVHKMGKWLYNFWTDGGHQRGLWRRTTLAEFRKKEPAWEIVLDLDALGKAENESWVWHGASCLFPDYTKCMVHLSRGGSDAAVQREFDLVTKAFVQGGFSLPAAKSDVEWKDQDTLYVGTDFGPGSLTDSGYPRLVKEWRRGTPLAEARTLFEGEKADVSVSGSRQHTHGRVYDWISRSPTFFTNETFLLVDGKPQHVEKPGDAKVEAWDDQLLFTLRTDWTAGGRTWAAGSLLAIGADEFFAGSRAFTALFTPTAHTSLEGWTGMRSALIVSELEDVKSRLSLHTRGKAGWKREPITVPDAATFHASPYDPEESDDYWLVGSGFTFPTTLALASAGKPGREELKQLPTYFDATGIEVEQRFATSKDGTRVPYFVVGKKAAMAPGADVPTVINAYGGFEVSLTPSYAVNAGIAWLERGGVFVMANLRGGGEYGPAWHQAGLKHNRQRVYDDLIAVAEDLLARKVTSPKKLGVIGGSNGGLLTGVMLTQRPDLWGAIVCQVPLLDMKRYHKLLAGASWMDEYGNPDDPADWAAISKYSPYQNVKAGAAYPRTFFMTSTRDDRVHPGHARKMVARMLEQQHDVLYFENIEGGHGGAADNKQRAQMTALAWTFFARELAK